LPEGAVFANEISFEKFSFDLDTGHITTLALDLGYTTCGCLDRASYNEILLF